LGQYEYARREPSVESINSWGLYSHIWRRFFKERVEEKKGNIKTRGKINKREDRRNNQLVPFLFVGK
jgi:hypothetical protein